MTKKLTVRDYIEVFGTPKAEIARRIGLHRVDLYAYLEPEKYPSVSVTEEKLRKIAEFEGRTFATVAREYRLKLVA